MSLNQSGSWLYQHSNYLSSNYTEPTTYIFFRKIQRAVVYIAEYPLYIYPIPEWSKIPQGKTLSPASFKPSELEFCEQQINIDRANTWIWNILER